LIVAIFALETHNHFMALLDYVQEYPVGRHQKGNTSKVKPICIY